MGDSAVPPPAHDSPPFEYHPLNLGVGLLSFPDGHHVPGEGSGGGAIPLPSEDLSRAGYYIFPSAYSAELVPDLIVRLKGISMTVLMIYHKLFSV